jgi:hypothetical protein
LDSDKLNEGPQLAPDSSNYKKWKIAESTKEKENSQHNPDLVGSITRAGRVINLLG